MSKIIKGKFGHYLKKQLNKDDELGMRLFECLLTVSKMAEYAELDYDRAAIFSAGSAFYFCDLKNNICNETDSARYGELISLFHQTHKDFLARKHDN